MKQTKTVMEYFMKKANILLDEQSTGLTIIEKMDFESVDDVHSALLFSFHPTPLEDDEMLDDRFVALWILFLASVGWTEDEFWVEYKSRSHDKCPKCGSEEIEQSNSDGYTSADKSETPDPKDMN